MKKSPKISKNPPITQLRAFPQAKKKFWHEIWKVESVRYILKSLTPEKEKIRSQLAGSARENIYFPQQPILARKLNKLENHLKLL